MEEREEDEEDEDGNEKVWDDDDWNVFGVSEKDEDVGGRELRLRCEKAVGRVVEELSGEKLKENDEGAGTEDDEEKVEDEKDGGLSAVLTGAGTSSKASNDESGNSGGRDTGGEGGEEMRKGVLRKNRKRALQMVS